MIVFPNCKINLGLQVVSKREDGYHDIETLFYPLPYYDVLEIIQSKDDKFHLTTTGIPAGSGADNLCTRAWQLLLKDFPKLPAVHILLHKNIPVGAGLGGGSSDATHTLLLLNQKFELGLNPKQFFDYALQLGSDCPFFLHNKPTFGYGRGEILHSSTCSLRGYKILLVHPEIHISTAALFGKVKPKSNRIDIAEIVQKKPEEWKGLLINDFEEIAFAQHPELATIKAEMYQRGAIYASMTGTGSTIFGLFKNDFPESTPTLYPHKWILTE